MTFAISPELNGYKSERSRQLFERLEDELAALPGVTGVTTALVPLLAGSNWGSDVQVEGFQSGPGHRQQLPLQRGRPRLLPHDGRAAHRGPRVHARRRRWARRRSRSSTRRSRRSSTSGATPSASASAAAARARPMDIEIIGLVQNAKYSEVKREVPPLFFRPYRQDDDVGSMTFYVRTSDRSRVVPRQHPEGRRQARSQPAGREPADARRSRCRTTSSWIAS